MPTPDNEVVFTPGGQVAGTTPESVDYKTMYESRREESERLSAVITAGRLQPTTTAKGDDRKPMTAERLRALMGPTGWLKSTIEEKIIGLGQNPKEIDVDFLKRTFGKKNDGKTAQDLHKTNPFKYRQLKELSLVLGIFGA